MYVFPGIGLAAILCKAVSVTQDMIYASGEGLSESLNEQEKADDWLYPDIRRIREVSVVVTRAVIRAAQKNGVTMENIQDFRLSWEKSERETKRLIEHFRSLAPHFVRSTLSLNQTRI